jgi:putative protease
LDLAVQPVPVLAVSRLNDLRRGAIESLREQRRLQRQILEVAIVPNDVPSPERELNYLANVLNGKAAAFFQRHGAVVVESAAESGLDMSGRRVMKTRYCIRYEIGAGPRAGQAALPEPLWLVDPAGRRLRLEFDCDECCMSVIL